MTTLWHLIIDSYQRSEHVPCQNKKSVLECIFTLTFMHFLSQKPISNFLKGCENPIKIYALLAALLIPMLVITQRTTTAIEIKKSAISQTQLFLPDLAGDEFKNFERQTLKLEYNCRTHRAN